MIGLSLIVCISLYLFGWLFTGFNGAYVINTFVGILVSVIILMFVSFVFTIASIIYILFPLSENSAECVSETLSEEDADRILLIENIVKPMNEQEFWDFLDRDGYGNKNPDEKAILNLLEMIKSIDGYKDKEILIYKKLESLKNGQK